MGDERLLDYVRSAAEEADLVASVGTGSLILAAAGLLDGRRATAPPAYRGILANLGAECADGRWVEDGEFTTAGGTSGGIDMGLHLVAKHRNKRSARQVQLWVEYDPQPPFVPMDRDATGEELAQLLARHRVDPEQALTHRSDLLEAVRGALRPAARAKTGR
jgi:transcriptional regulator GlxA family with amidase domain